MNKPVDRLGERPRPRGAAATGQPVSVSLLGAARPDAHSENVQWDNPQAGSPWETQTTAPF